MIFAGRQRHARELIPIEAIASDALHLRGGGLRAVLECATLAFGIKGEAEQRAVIDGWCSLLSSLPHPLQIVIHSRPAHEGDLGILRSGEVSAALAGIGASYDRLLRDLTASSDVVQRTFYAVVPLDASAVLRRRNAAEQSAEVARLHERTQTVAQQLDRAGVKSRVLSTGELVEALYSQVNSELARRQPVVPEDLVANRVRDLIAPSAFERTRDAFTVDQRATQTLAIVGYPRFLHLLHIAYDERHRPIEVAVATWPGPMTALTEEYQIPAERPGLPLDDPDLALG